MWNSYAKGSILIIDSISLKLDALRPLQSNDVMVFFGLK